MRIQVTFHVKQNNHLLSVKVFKEMKQNFCVSMHKSLFSTYGYNANVKKKDPGVTGNSGKCSGTNIGKTGKVKTKMRINGKSR